MTRVERAQQLKELARSQDGFAELNRIWMAMRERRKLAEPRVGILGSQMVTEILDDEFPQGQSEGAS